VLKTCVAHGVVRCEAGEWNVADRYGVEVLSGRLKPATSEYRSCNRDDMRNVEN
jgi:hypothetical protein